MPYADYIFYTDTYLGNAIAEADFPRLAQRASEQVDHITRYRAAEYFAVDPDPISNATCAIAEILQQSERGNALNGGGSGSVQAETTGKHQITYADPINTASETGQQAINELIMAAARRFLFPTGLLYRGVMRC